MLTAKEARMYSVEAQNKAKAKLIEEVDKKMVGIEKSIENIANIGGTQYQTNDARKIFGDDYRVKEIVIQRLESYGYKVNKIDHNTITVKW